MLSELRDWFRSLTDEHFTVGFWGLVLVIIIVLFWHRILRDVMTTAAEV